jgi:predicted ATPase
VFAIRKIEMGERRPSRQLAGLLAQALEIPSEHQGVFIKVARGELSLDRLAATALVPPSHPQQPAEPGTLSGSLPRALTPFIGREPELAALEQLLGDSQCRLLTIAGPGGVGKTRLAVEAANHSRDLFPDGVWFIPLVSLNSPALIIPAIAEAINFKFSDPVNLEAQLLQYLCPQKVLLVMDNAEHLLDGVGVLADILEDCPQVKLLMTSRERLSLLSEWVFEIQGLPVPASDQVKQIEDFSSVALFLQSARRVQAGFEIRESDRKWVLQICRDMEGIPLAIELSAAWVGLLSCEQIARRIEHSLDFLSGSMRDLPERHRSLRATLDHSWKLLNEEERLVLSRLSVFRGSFSLEAAQEICGASLVLLSSLKNKCLLYRTEQELFHLHQIIRQYAGRKLAGDPDENERTKDRHAAYYVQCLANWEKALQSSRQLETFDEMAQVIDNLSQGWRHMVTHCHPGKGSQFCAETLHSALFSISLFYEMRCRNLEAIDLFKESVDCLKSFQAEFDRTEDRTRFRSVLGHMTAYLGLHQLIVYQHAKARENLEEALHLLADSQSMSERAQARAMLAWIYYQQGEMQKSAELLLQGITELKGDGCTWWYLLSSSNLALVYIFSGNLSESEMLCQEGLRLIAPGDYRLALHFSRVNAYLYYFRDHYLLSEQIMKENLQLANKLKSHRGIIANCLTDLSLVSLATHRFDAAEKYLQECINLVGEYGESYELAFALLYLGKYFVARSQLESGREKFRQVIKMGEKFDAFYLIYWGLVNIARTYRIEGQTRKALEISSLIERCPVEYKLAQDEGVALLADLQEVLPEGRTESEMKQINSSASREQARADVLAYVQENESG